MEKIKTLLLAYLIKIFIYAILKTCRIKITGIENLIDCAKKHPCILALWHNRLGMIAHILAKYTSQLTFVAFISKSKDGEILAAFTDSYSRGSTIRVPHDKRGIALKQLICHLKQKRDIVLITPDGPRGPMYQVKPGIIVAAQETDAKIISFSWDATRFWELKSWDRFRIPKPFSIINVSFESPLSFSGDKSLENCIFKLQNSMR